MSTTIGTAQSGSQTPPAPSSKTERIFKAFRRKAAQTKRSASSLQDGLSEKYEAVKDRLEGNKSAHDYNRRVERFSELIATCKGDPSLAAAVLEAEKALKGFPVADAAASSGTKDWSDEHFKTGLAIATLTQAREDAEIKAADASAKNPAVAATITSARTLLEQRRLPDAQRLTFATQVDDLARLLVNRPGEAGQLAVAAKKIQDAIIQATNVALNATDFKMRRHDELSRQLAGSKAADEERLAIAGILQDAESAIRIYDDAEADRQLDAAAKRLGKPGKLPSASDLTAPIAALLGKLSQLAGKVGSAGVFEKKVYDEAVGVTGQVESLQYMLEKGGDVAAVDGERMLDGYRKAHDRLAKIVSGHDNFVKTLPAAQQMFDGECKRVAAAAATLYAKQGAPKGSKGVYDTRLDALKSTWTQSVKDAICEEDLNLDALIGELEAIEAEMKASGGKMTPEQIKFDATVHQFNTLVKQLDGAAETLMASNSGEAFRLGLLTDPAKLRLDGEQLTKSPPPPSELAARITALEAVNARISAKLDAIGKVKIAPADNPDTVRAACQQLQAAHLARIEAGLKVIAGTSVSLEVRGGERKALTNFAVTLKRDLALAAAPAEAGASSDVAILKATLAELNGFTAQVASFEGMCPGQKHVKASKTFKEVEELVSSIDKKLGFPVFAQRAEMTEPWRTVIDAYKATPTRKDPAKAVPELAALKETVRSAVAAANAEHDAAEAMKTEIENIMSDVTLARGALKAKIEASPKCFLVLMRDLQTLSSAIGTSDKADPRAFQAMQVRKAALFDLGAPGNKARTDAEKAATEAEAVYSAAKFKLEEVLAVDIRLLEESAKAMSGDAKTEMKKQLSDMRKAASGALSTLKQNRDAAAADAMCDSIKSRLKMIEASPLGNTTRNRNELPKVRQRWTDTINRLHRDIESVPGVVKDACVGDPAALEAAQGLDAIVVGPLKALFRPDAFDATIKRMAVADEAGLVDAREDALREIRKIRRVLTSEPLVKQLMKTPFPEAEVSFRTVEMALWDLETNLLTSDVD